MGRPPIHHPDRASTSTERQRATRKRTKEAGGTSLAIRLNPDEATALRLLQEYSGKSARDIIGQALLERKIIQTMK